MLRLLFARMEAQNVKYETANVRAFHDVHYIHSRNQLIGQPAYQILTLSPTVMGNAMV
jgi:hypothetical protein